MIISFETIKKKLAFYSPKRIEDKISKKAGVIVPIYGNEGEIFIVLTKRTLNLKRHKGEISFPGGVCELSEDQQKTALRECFEEIGVKMEDLKLVGRLDDTYTKTGYLISPFVAFIPYPYNFMMNPKEVESLVFLPIQEILDPEFHEKDSISLNKGEKIFGATLRILKNLARILLS